VENFESESVISINNSLYAKTPEALEELLGKLRSIGYAIKDLRKAEHREVSIAEMEKTGWSLWFASLKNIQMGKCNSCHSLIKTNGIRSHGHKCEVCGAVTYYDVLDGSVVKFSFNTERYRDLFFQPKICFIAKFWDAENAALYLYPDPVLNDSLPDNDQRTKKYLQENKKFWRYVEKDGQRLILIKYANTGFVKDSDINMIDINGRQYNHSIVRVWQGKEYPEYGDFPVPETLNIYESWHWAPLQPTPTLHERILTAVNMVSDIGYYYQDGRPVFCKEDWQKMAKFIRHFTSLDVAAFNQSWPHFRRSGPGGIYDLAQFCHSNPHVSNQPNFGNSVVAAGKILEGEPLTDEEKDAAKKGLSTTEGKLHFGDLGDHFNR